MVEGKQLHAPIEASMKVLMAIDYCGHQLARRLGWPAPAYLKEEGATPHPGIFRHGLKYEGSPDWCLLMQVVM